MFLLSLSADKESLTKKPEVSERSLQEVKNLLSDKYTQEELSNPTHTVETDMLATAEQYVRETIDKKLVWFMIASNSYNDYFIAMFYDNEYNRANGSEL